MKEAFTGTQLGIYEDDVYTVILMRYSSLSGNRKPEWEVSIEDENGKHLLSYPSEHEAMKGFKKCVNSRTSV